MLVTTRRSLRERSRLRRVATKEGLPISCARSAPALSKLSSVLNERAAQRTYRFSFIKPSLRGRRAKTTLATSCREPASETGLKLKLGSSFILFTSHPRLPPSSSLFSRMAPFSLSLLRSQLRRNSKGFVPGTIILLVLFSLFHLDLFSPSSPSSVHLDRLTSPPPNLDDVPFDSPPLLQRPNSPVPVKAYDGWNPFLALDENGKPIPFQPPSSKSTAKKKPPRKVKSAASLVNPVLPDDFPSRESLPLPKDFPQFMRRRKSRSPNVTLFDDEKSLSKIRSLETKREPLARGGNWTSPRGTFAREWEAPVLEEELEEWPKVQFQGWEKESEEEKELREGRQEVVRNAFLSVSIPSLLLELGWSSLEVVETKFSGVGGQEEQRREEEEGNGRG